MENKLLINNANTVFEKKDDKYFGYKSRFGDIVIGGAYSYRFVVHYAKTNQDVVIVPGDVNTVTTPVCTTLEERLWKPVQKLVYAVLCFHADNTSKKSHPSVQTIADKCRCSTNTVRSALRRLKELELIDVKERKNGNGQTSNEYTLWEPPEWFVVGGTSKKR
ncbi:helix-turn-helix domain-containing protein [Bacillus subtilis]